MTTVDSSEDKRAARVLLFLVGCMGARFGLAWLAHSSPEWLPSMGVAAGAVSLGFFYIWANGLRKTGPEVFGDRIWWDHLRPVHGALYALFAALALRRSDRAWAVLAADALIGLAAFLSHHLGETKSRSVKECGCQCQLSRGGK